MKKKMTVGHMTIIVVLILLAIICLYPIWYMLICSVSDKVYVEAGRVRLLPKGINFTSYQRILGDELYFSSFWVSVRRVIAGCTLNLTLLILTAYPMCLPQKKFPPARYIKWFFMANMLFNGGLIPSYVLMRQYGLFDSFWALILPGAVPLWNLVLMVNFFRNIPYELNESVTIDGGNPLQILFQIYVPLSKPSLACMFLFQFVGHWNSYFDGLMYINDRAKQPLQTYIYQLSVQIDFSKMDASQIMALLQTSNKTLESAKVFVALIPILCIYPFIQKYFTTGMTMGAVKG